MLLDVIAFLGGDARKVEFHEIRGTVPRVSESPVKRIEAGAQVYDLPFAARQLHRHKTRFKEKILRIIR